MDSRQVVARFEAERQALALMDHPNIAKVFDGGVTGEARHAECGTRNEDTDSSSAPHSAIRTPRFEGRPYFVMELVKGTPITKYCDEKKLPVRERLELFADVCRAVQHAHQKGIIHRDLKPSNVMVAPYDGRAVVKVIDFGVAKATGQRLTDATLFTGFGAVVGTPEYMSPEQAELNNADIDTRSDIYSLGVLLYELLTGTTPLTRQRVKEAALLEVLRVIREEEPPRPSTRLSSTDELPSIAAVRGVEPAKLSRLVRGELDWIVMKSLEKDRTRRYETANGLAADIQRYLADESVQACPPSAGYRLRKFARRNKGRLAAAGVLAVAVLVAVAGVGWAVRDRAARDAEAGRQEEARQTESARQHAQRQAKVAGQVESILGEVERLAREQKWPEALAAARRADAAVAGGEADEETRERVYDALHGLAFVARLDRIRQDRSIFAQGKFKSRAAVADYATAFRDYGVDVETLPTPEAVARLRERPTLAMPIAAGLDDWVDARRSVLGKTDTGWKALVSVARGLDPDPLRDRLRAYWGQHVTPELKAVFRQLAESMRAHEQAPATLVALAQTLNRAQLGDLAVRMLREGQYAYPADFWLNFELGNRLHERKDYAGALRYFTAALALRPDCSAAHYNLGNALMMGLGKEDEAITSYRKATELDPKNFSAHTNLVLVLQSRGKIDETIGCLRRAIELFPQSALFHVELGYALNDQGKFDEAIAYFRKAIELAPKNARGRNGLAWLLASCPDAKLRNPSEAVALAKRAVELAPNDFVSVWTLGVAHYRAGDWKAAIAALEKSKELRNGGASNVWFFLAMAHWQLGEKNTAREWYDRAVQWMDKNQPRDEGLRRLQAEAETLMGVGGAVEVAPAPRPKK
jgi:tetratricopeptide (TPR) repeat protein